MTGVYGAVLRAGQSLFLFLTSVSLTFSPFVADLHYRGRTRPARRALQAGDAVDARRDDPGPARAPRDAGRGAADLRDGLRRGRGRAPDPRSVGMIVPVMVGTVGFILIMAGRTGWDLLVYMAAFALDVGSRSRSPARTPSGSRGRDRAGVHAHVQRVVRLLLVRRFLEIWPFEGELRAAAPGALVVGASRWRSRTRSCRAEVVHGPGRSFAVGASVRGRAVRRRSSAANGALVAMGGRRATIHDRAIGGWGGRRPPIPPASSAVVRVRPLRDDERGWVRRDRDPAGVHGSSSRTASFTNPTSLEGFVAEDGGRACRPAHLPRGGRRVRDRHDRRVRAGPRDRHGPARRGQGPRPSPSLAGHDERQHPRAAVLRAYRASGWSRSARARSNDPAG